MKSLRNLYCFTVLLSLLASHAVALQVSGKILDAEGKPLAYVRVRLSVPDAVPFSTTVFSASDGSFSAPTGFNAEQKIAIELFRIGWKESGRSSKSTAEGLRIQATMQSIDNVAEQLPASAWLQGDKDSMAYRMSTLHCSNCHQLGAERVRRFSAQLARLPVDERSEAWLKRSVEDLAFDGKKGAWLEREDIPPHQRVTAWKDMVQYMRWVTMHLGEHKELRWGLKEGSDFYNALLQPETSLFVPRDMEIIVPNLAHNFPVKFDNYKGYDDIAELGEYGVTAATVIDEFVLPTFGWTREIAIAPGSSDIWLLETDKDRLGALNPRNGVVTWYDVPGTGQQGPHTMNADAQGNLWIALEDSFYIARFNTQTKSWRMYPPPEGKVFGVTHDFAYNSDRHVEPDSDGRIWITDLGMNELWGINIDSGEIKTYKMPLAVGETHFHSLLYGAVFDTARDRVWWAQLYGNVGSFDTKNNTVERIVPFERGAGPRRLAIQQDGTLWIPLFGSAELVKFDSVKGIELARYSIPDAGAAPYGVTLDKKRNAIWAATSNSDRIYRFDIATEQWRHYPMPRKETYIRMLEIDPLTGDIWTTYSSLPVGKRDPQIYGTASANNMIVRLRPGD
jgi:streptogramin lyase